MATTQIFDTIHVDKKSDQAIASSKGLMHGYWSFTDRQKAYETAWWFASLLLHGCILVPLTFLFVYSFDGPALVFLFISMISFFTNFIGFMGGAPFKFNITSLFVSVLIHASMLLSTLLLAF